MEARKKKKLASFEKKKIEIHNRNQVFRDLYR